MLNEIERLTFTVDTHLFRELGALLVGRDSTALIELIKNAYDADATSVTVYGENLNDPERAIIVLDDDGVGMSRKVFQDGFLRVASRFRDQGERKSQRFGRRFTGAKGVGRLAAHKLAAMMEVRSISSANINNRGQVEIRAKIDWDKIEEAETLDQVDKTEAVTITEENKAQGARPGTTIRLTKLRKPWTDAERTRFVGEVQSYAPPEQLIRLPDGILLEPPLIVEPRVSDVNNSLDSWNVELLGDFETGDEYWQLKFPPFFGQVVK